MFSFVCFVSLCRCYDQRRAQNVERLMAFHQFWDAYQELTNMINSESSGNVDNRLYMMRAKSCLNMGMLKECIDDTNKILKKSPNQADLKNAYLLQARAHIQKGSFKDAKTCAEKSGDMQSAHSCEELVNTEKEAYSKIESGQLNDAARLLDSLLRNAPKATKIILDRAGIAWQQNDLGKYKELVNSKDLEKELSSDSKFFYRQGIVSFCDGQISPAMRSVKKAKGMRMAPKNCTAALNAIQAISEHYPLIQKAIDAKDAVKAEDEIEISLEAGTNFCPSNSVLISSINLMKLKLIRVKNTPEETLEILNKMLEKDTENVDFMLERGEVNLDLEDFDAALFDFQNAQRHRPGEKRAQQGIEKANEIKKKKTFIDHYGTLGIQKGASANEIKTAYQKMVRLWHPDRYSEQKKKKEAEAMMKKINQAYDVLGDNQKKALYDAGRDPDDPNAGQQNFGFEGFPFDIFNFASGGGGGGGRTFHFQGGQGFHFEFQM